MKKRFIAACSIAMLILLISIGCSTKPENKLIGTWRAVDVQAEFDEMRFSPEMLKQVIQMEKEVYFKFLNDSLMQIIAADFTNEAYWYYEKNTGLVTFRFKDAGSALSDLGVYKDGKIISESHTGLGTLTIIYGKDE